MSHLPESPCLVLDVRANQLEGFGVDFLGKMGDTRESIIVRVGPESRMILEWIGFVLTSVLSPASLFVSAWISSDMSSISMSLPLVGSASSPIVA